MTKAALFAAFAAGALGLSGLAPAHGADDLAKLKQEVELLKRENDLLKRENAVLAKENELLKAGGGPAGKGKKDEGGKTTLDDVEYEFVSIRRDGNKATLTVAATSQRGTKTLASALRLKLTATDGAVYQSPGGTSGGKTPAMGKLVEGVRQLIEFDLGMLPSDKDEFSAIMIPGTKERPLQNPVILKGTFKVEK